MDTPTLNTDLNSILIKQQNHIIMIYQNLCEENDKGIALLEEKIKNLENELEIYKKNQTQNKILNSKKDTIIP